MEEWGGGGRPSQEGGKQRKGKEEQQLQHYIECKAKEENKFLPGFNLTRF